MKSHGLKKKNGKHFASRFKKKNKTGKKMNVLNLFIGLENEKEPNKGKLAGKAQMKTPELDLKIHVCISHAHPVTQ